MATIGRKSPKHLILLAAGTALLTGGAVFILASPTAKAPEGPSSRPSTLPPAAASSPRQQLAAEGRYTTYSTDNVGAQGYETTLIFFHAPWCPQCREFEKNITAGTVPMSVQILKTDYDTSTELRKQYGVTLQTTFVRVNPEGNLIKKWVGYTSDHKLETLLKEFES
jgi:thiol-disulfide isomerase/thioredoxin